MPFARALLLLASVPFVLLSACADGAAEGTCTVLIAESRALSAEDVARVAVEVTGPGIPSTLRQDLTLVNGVWRGTIGRIPVGSGRTFAASAFDSGGGLLYSGEAANVTIQTGPAAVVALVLQQADPPAPFANTAVQLTSLVASAAEVAPGETILLTAAAEDPDPGDTLTFRWTASGGTFSNPGSAQTAWTAPAQDGAQTLRVEVQDSHGAVAQLQLGVSVSAANARGSASISVSFNHRPAVSAVAAMPGSVEPGQGTALAVAASDADLDSLAYSWTTTCMGTLSAAGVPNPSLALDAAAPANPCDASVVVTDGRGGSATGTVTLRVGPPVQPHLAPRFDSTYQSQQSVEGGDRVVLRVGASSPSGAPLTFAWATTEGSLGAPVTTATTSEVALQIPQCASGAAIAVTAAVTDAAGASAQTTFQLAPPASCVQADGRAMALWSTAYATSEVSDEAAMLFTAVGDGRLLGFHLRKFVDPATGALSTLTADFPNDGVSYGHTGLQHLIWRDPTANEDRIISRGENTHSFSLSGVWQWSGGVLGCCDYSRSLALERATGRIWSPGSYDAYVFDAATGAQFPGVHGADFLHYLSIAGSKMYGAGHGGSLIRWDLPTRTVDWVLPSYVPTHPGGLPAIRRGAIDWDGALVVSSWSDSRLIRVSAAGTVDFDLAIGAVTAPVLGADGRAFVGTSSGTGFALEAFSRQGARLWRRPVGVHPRHLLVGDDGKVYALLGDGATAQVIAVSQDTGALRLHYTGLPRAPEFMGDLLLDGGRLFARTAQHLYAFSVTAVGYDSQSPWPLKYYDNQGTHSR